MGREQVRRVNAPMSKVMDTFWHFGVGTGDVLARDASGPGPGK
jgi:hypothetical protein